MALSGPWDLPNGDNMTMPEMPGPRGKTFAGPWLQQQIVLSFTVGFMSMLVFGLWKRHYPAMYLARHHAQGSALPYQKMRNGLFSWILPTILYSDHSVLHTVGLDGAVALLFLKMCFVYLTLSTLWAVFVLMPINYYSNGWVDGVKPGETPGDDVDYMVMAKKKQPQDPLPVIPFPSIVTRDTLYENTQLLSTFLYSLLAMWVLRSTYHVFIRYRQGHACLQRSNETARTVEVRMIPDHLRTVESLESYFSDIHLDVEHVSILKDTQLLDKLLIRRAKKLQQLERAWFKWIGDEPVDNYHPDEIREQTLAFLEAPRPGDPPVVGASIVTSRPRPKMLATNWRWFGQRVDRIDQLSYEFASLDATVQELRDSQFKDGHTAFVTFHNAWSSQIASQVVHYPVPGSMLTEPAMEPRDIIWMNEETNVWDRRARQGVMTMLIGLLLTLTLSIDFVLATLVNVNEIREYLPWLGDMLNEHAWLRTFVQNSLPTLLLILINALIPVAMRYSTYFQRIRSHSRVDHSVLNKYYLYLLFSVVFVFLFTSARDMLKELSQSPMHMIDKLAQSLPVARNFSLSYVVFQGLALQPFQLVLLPTILSQQLCRMWYRRTPRRRMQMYQPPMLNMSTLYPQALLIFTLSVLYSIVSPLITLFGAICAYWCYLHRLWLRLRGAEVPVVEWYVSFYSLAVFEKPYDSHGHAWPLAIRRCIWALVLFQVFQLSLFSVRKQVINSLLIVPLIFYTIWFANNLQELFLPLTSYVNLHDIFTMDNESHLRVQEDDLSNRDADEPASNDMAQESFEPPLSWNHPGLLKVPHHTYGQPALKGRLPSLWLP